MEKKTVRKNPAAVSLGRRGARARTKALSAPAAQRSARLAVQARWQRAKPGPLRLPHRQRWWGVFALADYDPDNLPQALFWSLKETEARDAQPDFEDRYVAVVVAPVDVTYDPHSFHIEREFRPDPARQVKALQAVLDDEGVAP